jgi:HAD superfamily hydrolase (TIGR01549 family)
MSDVAKAKLSPDPVGFGPGALPGKFSHRLTPNGIQAILFDLDGTLRYHRPSSAHVFYDQAVNLGAEDAPEKRLAATRWTHYYWAQSSELMEDLKTFSEKEDAFWNNYARLHLIEFGCPPDLAGEIAPQLNAYMRDGYRPQDWVPPDVPATLQVLREAGFRLAVLSNRTLPCDDYVRELGLLSFFDFALVAGQVSYWKPDPEIFHHALQRLDIQPEQAVYVGDNYYADVVGSRRAGLRPVLIDSEGLFPDAGCETIHTMSELPRLLEHQGV